MAYSEFKIPVTIQPLDQPQETRETAWSVHPLGWLRSCYQEKFAVPRQPGLAPSATASLELLPPYNHPDSVLGLEAFSHLWLTFIFHKNNSQGWKPKVRPPRLGGNKKIGVFASRSPFRPNGLGLSVVRLLDIEVRPKVILHFSGIDLIDGTPIVDIKPYLPWSDARPEAQAAWAPTPPSRLAVSFSPLAETQLQQHPRSQWYRQLLQEVLSQDPKPAYHSHQTQRDYGVKLAGYNVRFRYISAQALEVMALQPSADIPTFSHARFYADFAKKSKEMT